MLGTGESPLFADEALAARIEEDLDLIMAADGRVDVRGQDLTYVDYGYDTLQLVFAGDVTQEFERGEISLPPIHAFITDPAAQAGVYYSPSSEVTQVTLDLQFPLRAEFLRDAYTCATDAVEVINLDLRCGDPCDWLSLRISDSHCLYAYRSSRDSEQITLHWAVDNAGGVALTTEQCGYAGGND